STWVLTRSRDQQAGAGVVWPDKDPSMTPPRALKTILRARVAKTGERYTTARRQVLKNLPAKSPVAVAVPIAAPPAPAARSSTAATASTKGGLSDAKAGEKTGPGPDHWF